MGNLSWKDIKVEGDSEVTPLPLPEGASAYDVRYRSGGKRNKET